MALHRPAHGYLMDKLAPKSARLRPRNAARRSSHRIDALRQAGTACRPSEQRPRPRDQIRANSIPSKNSIANIAARSRNQASAGLERSSARISSQQRSPIAPLFLRRLPSWRRPANAPVPVPPGRRRARNRSPAGAAPALFGRDRSICGWQSSLAVRILAACRMRPTSLKLLR